MSNQEGGAGQPVPQVISDETVEAIPEDVLEAAYMALYTGEPGDHDMRAALAAVAPYFMSIGWDEGARAALDALNKQIRREPYKMVNPYRKDAR